MSALLVPPSHRPYAPNPGVALRTITAETYRAFLASSAGAALGAGSLQCPSWADVREGWRAQLLGWGPDPEAGRLTGVALVLLWQFPGTRKYFAYLPEGPVADWNDPDIDGWLGPLLEHLRRTGAFGEAAVDNAVTTQTGEPPAAALPAHAHPALPRAVRRAMAYCEEHAGDPVSVADMAVAAGVSPRTLQDRFRIGLGTTPAAHLRRVRLDRVHQDLLRIADGSASGTVAEVATRWGFTHLGRFAAYYREAYGQVPSRTAERRWSPQD